MLSTANKTVVVKPLDQENEEDERTRLLNEALGEEAKGLSQRAKKRLLKKKQNDLKWKAIKREEKELKAMAKEELLSRKVWGLSCPVEEKKNSKRKNRSNDRNTKNTNDSMPDSTGPYDRPKRACSGPELRRRLAEEYKEKVLSGYRVVLDCEFESLMHEKETRSLVQQVMFAYGANKRADSPCQVLLTGISPGTKVEAGLANIGGYERWGNGGFWRQAKTWTESMRWGWGLQPDQHKISTDNAVPTERPGSSSSSGSSGNGSSSSSSAADGTATVWDKSDLVYLTSDSPNTVHELDHSKIYIIGGIVDRNRHKSASFKKAEAAGIVTAKFPLAEHMEGKVSRCLALNHVFYILLQYGRSGGDWASAFAEFIPTRKGYTENAAEPNMRNAEAGAGNCNADAGNAEAGAGNGNADAGNGNADAGDADAGNGDADAGNGVADADAGNGNVDAGNGNVDAGNGDADAGNGDADAGNGVADAGNGDADAGNGVADAGNGDADAATEIDLGKMKRRHEKVSN
jgi:tRNA (guanine9-N1)-methyltransferase